MTIIHYQFADGHFEDINVSEEVAAVYEQLLIYEKKVERKETRRHISLNALAENGIELPALDTDILDIIDKQTQEDKELWKEKFRRKKSLRTQYRTFSFANITASRSVFPLSVSAYQENRDCKNYERKRRRSTQTHIKSGKQSAILPVRTRERTIALKGDIRVLCLGVRFLTPLMAIYVGAFEKSNNFNESQSYYKADFYFEQEVVRFSIPLIPL